MRLRPTLLLAFLLAFFTAAPLFAAENPPIFPLSEVHAGMKGEVYTIFSGDQIEKVDLVVLGVLQNALGPKQDIILVQLLGPEVEKTGVVAGMSGSPVYFDGKLAGALSLKIGTFSKDPIAGVTPIQNMLAIQNALPGPSPRVSRYTGANATDADFSNGQNNWNQQVAIGDGQYLVPIETPLIFSGVSPSTLSRFSSALGSYGMSIMTGGTVPPQPSDSKLQPGDMVGMDLVSGDLSLYAGCTVTAIIGDEVFVCGHPFNGYGNVAFPMTRAHVITTLASSYESTKIMNTGGTIGTITQDRLTGVMGLLGHGPAMIPVDVNMTTPRQQIHFHFQVVQNPTLTPLLVALSVYNGIVSNTAYSTDATLQMSSQIDIAGHPSVQLGDMFPPTGSAAPGAFGVALALQSAFVRIFENPYEIPKIDKVSLTVASLPDNLSDSIDGAWCDKSEAQPGDTVNVKVMMRPYRGEPVLKQIPVVIPPQAARGTLQILVSDSQVLNRMREAYAGGQDGGLQDLNELITLINRSRHNDDLYVTLLQNSPTLLVEDKELPDVPASAINVLDQRRLPGGARLLFQSVIGQYSVPVHQVVSGEQYLTITIK